jgi:hypothetical protein
MWMTRTRDPIQAIACALVLLVVWQPATCEAGSLGRLLGRAGAKAPAPHGAPKPSAPTNILKQDLVNHRKVPVRSVERERTVFRFTTKEQAKKAQHQGLLPGRHMTAHGGPGRPLSPDHAQSRYGLHRKSDAHARITLHLKKGQPVRSSKIAGANDQRFRELTSPERVPRSSIVGVTPLKPRGR